MIRDIGDKNQKSREYLAGFGRTCIGMSRNIVRGLKTPWAMNNLVCRSFMKKLSPYYVQNLVKLHSSKIWSKIECFEILAIRAKGSGFQLSHQDHELIL